MNTDDLNDVKAWMHYYAPEPLKTKLKLLLKEHVLLWDVVNSMPPDYISSYSNDAEGAIARLQQLVLRN